MAAYEAAGETDLSIDLALAKCAHRSKTESTNAAAMEALVCDMDAAIDALARGAALSERQRQIVWDARVRSMFRENPGVDVRTLAVFKELNDSSPYR